MYLFYNFLYIQMRVQFSITMNNQISFNVLVEGKKNLQSRKVPFQIPSQNHIFYVQGLLNCQYWSSLHPLVDPRLSFCMSISWYVCLSIGSFVLLRPPLLYSENCYFSALLCLTLHGTDTGQLWPIATKKSKLEDDLRWPYVL